MSGHMVPAPGSAAYEYQISNYNQDERPQQYVAIIICTVVATLAVATRIYAQRVWNKIWGLDDLFIVVALLVLYGQTIASILALKAGAGLHQVRVIQEDMHKPDGLLYIYTNYWIVSVLWAPAVMFVKLSILIVYERLFYVRQHWFKVALWINALYAIGLGVASTFVFIFQCWPVDYYWRRFLAYYGYPAPAGTCLPQLAHLITPQILSTASDLVILFLPVPVIWQLHAPLARRVAVSLVFLMGAFTVGCGIARIAVIFRVSNVADVTWNNIDTVTFTVVEAGVGIFCACMPPSAPVYTALMRRWGLMSGPEQSQPYATTDSTEHFRLGTKTRVWSSNSEATTKTFEPVEQHTSPKFQGRVERGLVDYERQ